MALLILTLHVCCPFSCPLSCGHTALVTERFLRANEERLKVKEVEMRTCLSLILLFLLGAASVAMAQCKAGDGQWPSCLMNQFSSTGPTSFPVNSVKVTYEIDLTQLARGRRRSWSAEQIQSGGPDRATVKSVLLMVAHGKVEGTPPGSLRTLRQGREFCKSGLRRLFR